MRVVKLLQTEIPVLMAGGEIETGSRRSPVLPVGVVWHGAVLDHVKGKATCMGQKSGVEVRHVVHMPTCVGDELKLQEPYCITKDGEFLYRYDYKEEEAKQWIWRRAIELIAPYCKRVVEVTGVDLIPAAEGKRMDWVIRVRLKKVVSDAV